MHNELTQILMVLSARKRSTSGWGSRVGTGGMLREERVRGRRVRGGRVRGGRERGGKKLYKSCCLEVQSILTLFSLLPQQLPSPPCLLLLLFYCLFASYFCCCFFFYSFNFLHISSGMSKGKGKGEGGAASVAKKQMPEAAL